jgi:DMSO/TMAO reductase YedYZ molybdopterin-dependent catalytic subunit
MTHDHDPLQPHSHDPNPEPPSADPSFILRLPDGHEEQLTLEQLRSFSPIELTNCYIISTGHGTSGPFTFSGVPLIDFITHYAGQAWSQVEVISADGFGNRVTRDELLKPQGNPIILAYEMDSRPLTRQQGLVRLIVPSETDDALRQVKWVGRINIV